MVDPAMIGLMMFLLALGFGICLMEVGYYIDGRRLDQ